MALKNFVSGEVLTESDLDIYCVNTLFARKTATEPVTSSTTLQNDDHLTVPVAANSVYEMSSLIKYDGATGGDLKLLFRAPTSATLSANGSPLIQGAASQQDIQTLIFAANASEIFGCLGAGATLECTIQGLLIVVGTAGNFNLEWAQATSSATATNLFADSYICLRRVE